MPGLVCHEHTAHPPGEAELTVLTPRGRSLETCCLFHARKTDVAQMRHWVPTLFLCLCEVQNYPIHIGETPRQSCSRNSSFTTQPHRAGGKVITKPPCREGHWENSLRKGELSNKVLCQEDGRGMCSFQAHREKTVQKKNSTDSRNGGEIKKQKQSMINKNKNHSTEAILNILI